MDRRKAVLQLDYPCRWTYKVIGSVEGDVRGAVAEVLGDCDHTLSLSNNSRSGRYLSFKVALTVHSEAQQVGLYLALSQHRAIKIVL